MILKKLVIFSFLAILVSFQTVKAEDSVYFYRCSLSGQHLMKDGSPGYFSLYTDVFELKKNADVTIDFKTGKGFLSVTVENNDNPHIAAETYITEESVEIGISVNTTALLGAKYFGGYTDTHDSKGDSDNSPSGSITCKLCKSLDDRCRI